MGKKILVSACLLGTPCRYDGAAKPHQGTMALQQRGYELIPVCPEVLGGLSTPRPPAERQKDGRIINREGQDVTVQYNAGAQAALDLARREGCTLAVLKARSPSCGRGEIYDGTFSGTLVSGDGAAAALLTRNGIRVLREDEIQDYLNGTEEER